MEPVALAREILAGGDIEVRWVGRLSGEPAPRFRP